MIRTSYPTHRVSHGGFTLIELMVAILIGLVLTLAVTSTYVIGESHRRVTTSTNDMDQTGNYATSTLDRAIRSAGSGFKQGGLQAGAFACRLNASLPVGPSMPRTTAFPAPFAGLLNGSPGKMIVAPVLIAENQSDGRSDVLIVMGGSAASGDVPRLVASADPTGASLRLFNTVGLNGGDLGLVSQKATTDCFLEQVNTSFVDSNGNDALPLAGSYVTAGTSLAPLVAGGDAYFSPLGKSDEARFQLFGVGADRTLYSYDLLKANGIDESQAIANNVVAMHALYGIDSNGDGVLDQWVSPQGSDFAIDSLMNDKQAPDKIRQIVAVHVAVVLQSDYAEKPKVSGETFAPDSITLFSDVKAAANVTRQVTLDPMYRYRVVETTIPLRNLLMP